MNTEYTYSNKIYNARFLNRSVKGPVILLILSDRMENITDDMLKTFGDKAKDFLLCEIFVHDWDSYLTPWPLENCLENRTFMGNASELCDSLKKDIIPYIRNILKNDNNIYICGYSLAGLFALWALYENAGFSGAISCSGSLWYPGYREYINNHSLKKSAMVYLSLGDREPLARHSQLKSVGDITKLQYEILQADKMVHNVVFKWQKGGHFSNVNERIIDGIKWILAQEMGWQ